MTDAAADVTDRASVIAELEEQLRATPRSVRPYEHATLMFRLGLAYAESGGPDPAAGLRRALACYDVAAAIFDPRFDPVEHGRVLNMAGAAHRGLGDRRRAVSLFQEAATLLEGRARDDELAAVWNNLGLVLSELGDTTTAVDACDRAIELFDESSPEGRRGRAAALHTRGTARAAGASDEAAQAAALGDFAAALALADPEESPYHYALVQHSIGITCTAVATFRPDEAENLLRRAAAAFGESLTVFSRVSFPYQHALAKHNLGRAFVGLGGTENLRRALVCFEDAAAVLDPRHYRPFWEHAVKSLQQAEAELATDWAGWNRAQHLVALLSAVEEDERRSLLRERLSRYLDLPPGQRDAALAELALMTARSGHDSARTVLTGMLDVLVELPSAALDAVLRVVVAVHRQLGEGQEEADRALDEAVSEALVGPQRVWVRDFLYSLDWERP